MESTLILIKPSGIERALTGEIISRLQRKGLILTGLKMMTLSESLLREHYAHLVNRPFFLYLLASMTASPVIAVCVKGKNAIEVVRNMVGSTDGSKATPGTIRGDYAMSNQENIVHASDSPESAAIEIKRFFKDDELFDYIPANMGFLYDPEGN